MTRFRLELVAFVVSVAILAFVYGFFSQRFGWFPSALMERAYRQGRTLLVAGGGDRGVPDFVEPRVYRRAGARLKKPEAMQPGLTLITASWRDSVWRPGLRLIDRRGNVVHRWRIDPTDHFTSDEYRRGINVKNQDIHGSHLFPNGDVLVNVEYAGTLRLDACGRLEWKLAAGSHHSIHRADDGSFWIPGLSQRRQPRTEAFPYGFPGLDRPVYHGLLLNVSARGNVLKVLNILDVLYRNDLQDHIVLRFNRADVVHMNDIEPLSASMAEEYPLFETGDLLVSLRDTNLVLVLDPESGRVKWHASEPFRLQHDPDYLGDGWIGIFDNNWDLGKQRTPEDRSRIVAIQPHTDSTRVLFPTSRSEPFYTAHRGKWQRLENGNMLLAEADAGRVVEVTPDGRTVWEWIARPYDRESTPSVPKGHRHDLTKEDVAAWPCSPGDSKENRRETTE